MKLIPDTALGARAIIEALVGLPERARRFALERVAIVLTGGASHGGAIELSSFAKCAWLIVLDDRVGAASTFLHELAHCMSGHREPSVDAEHEAATLAQSWGARGDSGDADGCAGRFRPRTQPAPVAALSVDGRELHLACSKCGATCFAIALVVAGLDASCWIECKCSNIGDIVNLAPLVPCRCGERAGVTWAASATPEHPLATWACSCGERIERELRSGPDPSPPDDPVIDADDPVMFPLALAAADVARIAHSMRAMGADGPANPVAVESVRAGIVAVRTSLAKFAHRLAPDDLRRVMLNAAAANLARVSSALAAGDASAAADAVTAARRTLAALLGLPDRDRGDVPAATPEGRKS